MRKSPTYSSDPNEPCFAAVECLLSYLYHTRKDRIKYTKSNAWWNIPECIGKSGWGSSVLMNMGIYISPDAAWKIATDTELNWTYAGFIIFMCGAGLDWMSKLVKVICHSSAEAEIAAGCFAAKRGQYIRSVINEFKKLGVGPGVDGPFVYLIDNSATGPMTGNVGTSKKTEHFLRWQHYLRWIVYHKYGVVLWIDTNNQTADIMTKVLALGVVRDRLEAMSLRMEEGR